MRTLLKFVVFFLSIFTITFFIMFLSSGFGLAINQVVMIGLLSILLCSLLAWETRDIDTFVRD